MTFRFMNGLWHVWVQEASGVDGQDSCIPEQNLLQSGFVRAPLCIPET